MEAIPAKEQYHAIGEQMLERPRVCEKEGYTRKVVVTGEPSEKFADLWVLYHVGLRVRLLHVYHLIDHIGVSLLNCFSGGNLLAEYNGRHGAHSTGSISGLLCHCFDILLSVLTLPIPVDIIFLLRHIIHGGKVGTNAWVSLAWSWIRSNTSDIASIFWNQKIVAALHGPVALIVIIAIFSQWFELSFCRHYRTPTAPIHSRCSEVCTRLHFVDHIGHAESLASI